MRDFKINTTIGACRPAALNKRTASIMLTRGADGNLSLDIKDKAYTFDQIEQCSFILKQPSGKLFKYDMYSTIGAKDEMDTRFHHVYGLNYDYVQLQLEAIDTAELDVTRADITEFEVVIIIDGDTSGMMSNIHTIIERQPNIKVIDSLYGQYLRK